MAIHSDAADVGYGGYGGTLGFYMAAGTPGSWVGQGFWTAADLQNSITLCELRAVCLLLAHSFARFMTGHRVWYLLLHEDSAAVVSILNSMVSASQPMIAELRRL